jgi:hypothetical protein
MYRIEGVSTGTCGCRVALNCDCWGENSSPASSCCDSFLAFHIKEGTIDSIDVSKLNLVRLIRESEGEAVQSIVYVDAQASIEQREMLAQVFSGQSGGSLAQLAKLYPNTVFKVAPITYEMKGSRASIALGDIPVRQNVPQKSFSYTS